VDSALAGVRPDERRERAPEACIPGVGERRGVLPINAGREAGTAADRDGQGERRREERSSAQASAPVLAAPQRHELAFAHGDALADVEACRLARPEGAPLAVKHAIWAANQLPPQAVRFRRRPEIVR